MQSDNTMLEIMMDKLANQPSYMAWYFYEYAKEEKISFEDLKERLQLNSEQFGRLSMCRAPDGLASDFVTRLKTIQEFTGANYFTLAIIIRKVNSLESLKNSETNTGLLAARKQENYEDDNEKDK